MAGIIGILPILIPVVVAVVLIIVLIFAFVKTAKGNEALVISGVGATDKNGNPKIIRAGGSIVWPFLQRFDRFDCCIRTADVRGDVTKTITGVPIRLDWAVAYSPDVSSMEALQKAVCNFLDKREEELQRVVLDIVSGGVRAVISRMTPEAVMKEKDQLDDEVKKSIKDQMSTLGLSVTLSIHEVEDADGSTYYKDLAAQDRETKKRDAANIAADAQRSIREKKADTDRSASEAELAAQVAVAEKQRDADVKRAEFKAETDRRQVEADRAGELQQEEINRQLAVKQGAAEIERQNQADLAAQAAQKVAVTKAETEKKAAIIKAQADAEQKKTEAAGEAEAAATRKTREAEAAAAARKAQAEGESSAKVTEAKGVAEAKKTEAEAEAAAIKAKAGADAEAIRMKGEADAAAIAATGKAEAEAIEAKGKAEAEAERALSEARAANDRVNFEIQKLEIEQTTRVKVATAVAEVMAEVGKNAKFYDFSGGSKGEGGGDLLTSVLGRIPQLFAQADAQNNALNDENLTETVRKIVAAVADPIKGNNPELPDAGETTETE
ncbi:MAG: SPFH domain-containing protein [Candidatus Saccharibacteria bacterium]|jgi:flotillin|nr:SPFH domain-containing protein [Candidatus Saccharibacteria bacterium]